MAQTRYKKPSGCFFWLLMVFVVGLCGSAQAAPTITGIGPSSALAGGGSFTLTVDGSGFMRPLAVNPISAGSEVWWNQTRLETTFVSDQRVTAAVPASLIAAPGTATITVVNPIFLSSNGVGFVIQGPLAINAVVNAAGFFTGPAAAGTVVSIFGDGMGPSTGAMFQVGPSGTVDTVLGGTRVYFDGVAAPILYAQTSQVNAITPFGLAGRSSTDVTVEFQGVRSRAFSVPVADSSPALFTVDSSGRGQGAILNQDYSLNSPRNPAPRGTVVMIYATGGGQTDPPGTDGRMVGTPLPRLRLVSATVGGVPAEVQYAGGAPGLVSGVVQFNVLLPDGAPSGDQVQIQVRVGTAKSQGNVTLAIR